MVKTKNITGLMNYSAAKKKETGKKVDLAIEKLKKSKTRKISFKAVSELSGVSTTTLYNNVLIRERINSLKAIESHPKVEQPEIEKTQEHLSLKKEIQRLKEEKKMLISQLVEMEQLRSENLRLRAMLSEVKRE
jgi:small-conductance mechanosensitive channel